MTTPSLARYPSSRLLPATTARDITLAMTVAPARFTADITFDEARYAADLTPARFTVSLGADVRTIAVSQGAVEYVTATVTETSGADISGVGLQVSVGAFDTPGTWQAPDVTTHPTASTAVVKLLIGASLQPTAGKHWLWVQVADSPEILPVRAAQSFTIV